MPITDFVLSNGIRLITEPIATTKTVAIGFWFSGGSRDEGEKNAGITHFIEHMLFKGTMQYSAFDIARFFDRIGGYVNAFTERELVCLFCVVPAMYAAESLQVLCDMVSNSRFTDVEIEKERCVIKSEILATADDPEEYAMERASGLWYPGHGLGKPIAGTLKSLDTLSPEIIRSYYHTEFFGFPVLVTLAGNLEVGTIKKQLENHQFCFSENVQRVFTETPFWNQKSCKIKTRFTQSQLLCSFPVRRISGAKNWFSLSVINAIIGDTVSSRLFQHLREERGLCYTVYSFFSVNRDSAFWSAYAAVPYSRTTETVEALQEELDTVRRCGFTDSEITDAKSHLVGELYLSAEDIENRMKRLARQFLYDEMVLSVDESVSVLSEISNADISTFMQENISFAKQSMLLFSGKRGWS